jgi:hypothetical protein
MFAVAVAFLADTVRSLFLTPRIAIGMAAFLHRGSVPVTGHVHPSRYLCFYCEVWVMLALSLPSEGDLLD